jgi:hypothetical protein
LAESVAIVASKLVEVISRNLISLMRCNFNRFDTGINPGQKLILNVLKMQCKKLRVVSGEAGKRNRDHRDAITISWLQTIWPIV